MDDKRNDVTFMMGTSGTSSTKINTDPSIDSDVSTLVAMTRSSSAPCQSFFEARCVRVCVCVCVCEEEEEGIIMQLPTHAL